MAEGGTHFGGDRHIGVSAAKDDDRIAGCGAVGAGAQSPPHAERIDDRDARAAIEQSLDESLGGVGFAGARGADDGDPPIEGAERQRFRNKIMCGNGVSVGTRWRATGSTPDGG